jgi:Zn-dependent peptidase ImmA (M78 family)
MSNPINGINPSVLRWAREAQGLSVDDVALQLKRQPEEIESWEQGTSAPTYAQLEKLAYKVYRRPLAVFFLPKPPPEPELKREFRSLPDFEIERLAPATRYQVRKARALQISLNELNDGKNPSERKIFRDISFSASTNISRGAALIRTYLGVTLKEQSSWASADEALKQWRDRIEGSGVFVFKESFKQKEISGFCIYDDEFPIIYVNNSTSKTRQIFSLFHELAHLLLHKNAIAKLDEDYVDFLAPAEQRIERFCNSIAAAFLVPDEDFNVRIKEVVPIDDKRIVALARHYNVSREVILRKILDRRMIDEANYKEKIEEWASQATGGGGGGDYYATQASYLGNTYLRLVFSKHYQGKISLEQVADYLGVRSKSVGGLEELVLRRTTA